MSDLQHIVDSLAQSTRRAVSLHDRHRRLLAFSSHHGPVDEVRKESILTRRGPSKSFTWAQKFGIEESLDPVRIPANAALQMEARVCAPVRFEGRLLGFIWLVDPEASLPDDALERIRSAADAAGLAIHHQDLMVEMDRARERELLRDLLSEQAEVRAHAVDELIESGLLVPSDLTAVLVVRPVRGRSGLERRDVGVRAGVERALSEARHRAGPRRALQLVRPDHGVLLVTLAVHQLGTLQQVAKDLERQMAGALDAKDGWRAVVGIGEARANLVDSHLSYAEARKTAELCGLLTSMGPIARWSELGVYQALIELPLSRVDMSAIHPGLTRLLQSKDADLWLRTLECYLDLGCDARGAAKVLAINRGSLYHRLHRIEEVAGVDLRSGHDRLALHLGLKLARLAGIIEESAQPEAVPQM